MSSGTIGVSLSGVGPWVQTLLVNDFDHHGISLNWSTSGATAPLVSVSRLRMGDGGTPIPAESFDLSTSNASDNFAVSLYSDIYTLTAALYDGPTLLYIAQVLRAPYEERIWHFDAGQLTYATQADVGRALTRMYTYNQVLAYMDQVPWLYQTTAGHSVVWRVTADTAKILQAEADTLSRYITPVTAYVNYYTPQLRL